MLKIIIYNRRDDSDLLNFRTQRISLIDMESFHLLGNQFLVGGRSQDLEMYSMTPTLQCRLVIPLFFI